MTPSVALASQALATVRRRFASGRRRGLFRERVGAGGLRRSIAFNWSYSHAFAAALDVYLLGGDITAGEIDELVDGHRHYWEHRRRAGAPAHSSTVVKRFRTGAKFFDDNAWCGLNLMRLHRSDPSRRELLEQASATFEFAAGDYRRQRALDPESCGGVGIHWQQPRRRASPDIGTVANAANAQLALRLHEATRDPRCLDIALGMYSWVDTHLRDRATDLFWDHVTPPDCRVDETQWSYNQGLMIGAAVLLYGATNDRDFLRAAERTGTAALAAFDLKRLTDEPIEFAVILLRNLMLLTAVADDYTLGVSVRERATQYATAVWPRFIGDADRRVNERFTLIEQAAIVESVALACWPASRYDVVV